MTEHEQIKEHSSKPSQVGIKVIIVNARDEVLLLKRNPEAYSDGKSYWDIPGGRVENEVDVASIMSGGVVHPELSRELQEEIGWSPKDTSPISFVAHQQVETSGNKTVDRYTVSLWVNEDFTVKLSPEHTDYKWVPVSELKHTAHLGHALSALVSGNKINPQR